MTQPEALRLADVLENKLGGAADEDIDKASAELRRFHALIAACEPYLKEGETPVERMERDHRDSLALMTLLAREKTKNEALLEALKVVIDDLMYQDHARVIDVARAAIAKAEGEKT